MPLAAQTTGTLTEVPSTLLVTGNFSCSLSIISDSIDHSDSDVDVDAVDLTHSDGLDDGVSAATFLAEAKALRVYASSGPVSLADHTTSGEVATSAFNSASVGPSAVAGCGERATATYVVGASTGSGTTSVLRGTLSVNCDSQRGAIICTSSSGMSSVTYSDFTSDPAVGSIQAFIDSSGVQKFVVELEIGATGKSMDYAELTTNGSTCIVSSGGSLFTSYGAGPNQIANDIMTNSTLASCYVESYSGSASSASSSIGMSVNTTPASGPTVFRLVTDDLSSVGIYSGASIEGYKYVFGLMSP